MHRLLPTTFLFLLCSRVITLSEGLKTRLTWINGIAYSFKTAEQEKKEISRLFGGEKVIFCYNPTAMEHDDDIMGYLGDLTQAGTQKLGRFTAEVDGLVKHLREALASVGENGCVVHIAHSQGALITSLAAKKLMPEEMQRIEVIAFGGAAALRKTPETPFRRCINYYSINDPLLFVVPSAEQSLRSGFVTEHDEFCFLSPRVGDPIVDHYLLSPTYAQALQWEGSRFQRQYHSPVHRSTRKALLFTVTMAHYLHTRLVQLLKVLVRPLVLFCRQSYLWTKKGYHALMDKIVKPTIMMLAFLYEWAKTAIRKYKGEEDYVPVSKILKQQEVATSVSAK